MDITIMVSILIYGCMLFFLCICINPWGAGLIRLKRLSKDLEQAAARLNKDNYGRTLERQIRIGNVPAYTKLFFTEPLIEQMKQYGESIRSLEQNPVDKCRTDIDEYINYDLLHQHGRVDLCELISNGFTALGLLGTFAGMAFGLKSLQDNSATEIITGISGLLDGMDLAFLTSIVGIIASLGLGIALRFTLAKAESNLELFLIRFRSNVMRNQSEAALNEIIKHITSIESELNTANELQVTNLDRTATAFITKLNKELGLQIGFLQSAMQDMSREQHAHTESIQKLTSQMDSMSKSMQGVSNSFQPILTQSNELSAQIERANQALKGSVAQILTLLNEDTGVFSKHQEVVTELLRTSDALKQMADTMKQQSESAVAHYEAISRNCQTAMGDYLACFSKTSGALVDDLTSHSTANMETLQHHANELLRHMPRSGISTNQIEQLLQQNQSILTQQAQLIRIMEKTVAKRTWIWRKKK